MRNNLNLGLIIGFIALAGCQSTTTDNEFVCSTQTDWHQLGLTTAQKGKSVRAFDNYKAQCGDALPQNAQDLYLDGFTIGIKEYCTYENSRQSRHFLHNKSNYCKRNNKKPGSDIKFRAN